MKGTKDSQVQVCGGGDCTFSVAKRRGLLVCQSGGGDCLSPTLLEAARSNFYDETVAATTARINEIIAGVPADRQGRKLSFLRTPYGLLLAWVQHGGPTGPDAVPASADPETLAKALGLKNV